MTGLMITLADAGALAMGCFILASLIAANECGFRIGRVWTGRRLPVADGNIGVITAGMLGLLAFTLSLTMSIAEQRFEARRDLVVREANAVGTAWLRAGLAGEAGPGMRQDLAAYLRIRIDYTVAGHDPAAEAALHHATATAQARLWEAAAAVAQRRPDAISAAIVASLNEVFDAATAQRFAMESQVPRHIQYLLLLGSLLSVGAMGFQLGLGGHRHLVLTGLLMLMWTTGMLLIIDLNRPRQGNIRVDPAPLVWTLDGFAIPPPR